MKPIIIFLCLFKTFQGLAQAPDNRTSFHLPATKTNSTIRIDGDLNEDDWKAGAAADSFWLNAPTDNRRATSQTIVKIVHDEHMLYIGAWLRSASGPVVQTLKRDEIFEQSDAFGILIDPEGQKSLGYLFGVNAGGAQSEAIVSAAQGVFVDPIDYSWDAKWFSAVRKTEDGWYAEIAIPLKSIRFKKEQSSWGINFFRLDLKHNERQVWAKVPVQFTPFNLGFTGTLDWDAAPVHSKNNISITPYALGSFNKTNGISEKHPFKADMGGDAKISITPTLNIDLTVNPDFSQVEVDEQVTNLTRFSIFFPEKRQFFLENADIFTNFNSFPDAPFFSRRIGLDEQGNKVPILYGARLSGNLDKYTRIGFLNMQTKADTGNLSQNYTAAAIHRRILKRSTLRGLFLNRSELQDAKLITDKYSRNASFEFEYLSDNGRWNGKLSQNYGFKPDIKSNNQFSIAGGGYNGRNFQTYTEVQKMGTNYSADMGFVSRLFQYDPVSNRSIPVGYTTLSNITDYNIYPSSKKIVRHWIGMENYIWWVKQGIVNEAYTRLRYFMFFRNTMALKFRLNHDYVNLLYPFQITEAKPLPAQKYDFTEFNVEFNTDIRKRISGQFFSVYGSFYNGRKLTIRSALLYRVQPWGAMVLGFEWNDIRLPEPYGSARFLLINPKIQVDFSRKLYWTTFLQYNSQEKNLNINSRLQWRYRPMSDLFLVFTNNYQTENVFGPRNLSVVLKWNYYFQL